jgi:hypothetical protein
MSWCGDGKQGEDDGGNGADHGGSPRFLYVVFVARPFAFVNAV